MAKHVAVLMGGWSSERPVSLNSGKACADALEARGYRVTRVDVDRTVAAVLEELRPDVCFNALHGIYGEDGTVQGILEVMDIPYTHSGVLASALAMNKPKAKHVMKAAGIPVAEHKLVHRLEVVNAHVLEPPYVVKPPAEGSSFGVIIVPAGAAHPPQELARSDWRFGDMVMVEKYIAGWWAIGPSTSSECCRKAMHSMIMTPSTVQVGPNTFYPPTFHPLFTKIFKHWPSKRTVRSAAAASAGPISASMTRATARGR